MRVWMWCGERFGAVLAAREGRWCEGGKVVLVMRLLWCWCIAVGNLQSANAGGEAGTFL